MIYKEDHALARGGRWGSRRAEWAINVPDWLT